MNVVCAMLDPGAMSVDAELEIAHQLDGWTVLEIAVLLGVGAAAQLALPYRPSSLSHPTPTARSAGAFTGAQPPAANPASGEVGTGVAEDGAQSEPGQKRDRFVEPPGPRCGIRGLEPLVVGQLKVVSPRRELHLALGCVGFCGGPAGSQTPALGIHPNGASYADGALPPVGRSGGVSASGRVRSYSSSSHSSTVRTPLTALQSRHDRQRLTRRLVPPRLNGVRCSSTQSSKASGVPQ